MAEVTENSDGTYTYTISFEPPPPLRVINVDEVREWFFRLAFPYGPRVQLWATTIMLKWAITGGSGLIETRWFHAAERKTQLFRHFHGNKSTYDHIHFGELSELNEYDLKAYEEGQPLHVFMPPINAWREVIKHWFDFMAAHPTNRERYTFDVPTVRRLVTKWDNKLQRIKDLEALQHGIAEVPCPWIEETGEPWYVVKLLTRQARLAEGAYMRHCSGDGWYENETDQLFSIRDKKTRLPLYTVQTSSKAIQGSKFSLLNPVDNTKVGKLPIFQVKQRFNNTPELGVMDKVISAMKSIDPRYEKVSGLADNIRRFGQSLHIIGGGRGGGRSIYDLLDPIGFRPLVWEEPAGLWDQALQRMSRIHRPAMSSPVLMEMDFSRTEIRALSNMITVDSASQVTDQQPTVLQVKPRINSSGLLTNDAITNQPTAQPSVRVNLVNSVYKPDPKSRPATWSANPFVDSVPTPASNSTKRKK